jgi:F420H(2)-dependent quinone reductase
MGRVPEADPRKKKNAFMRFMERGVKGRAGTWYALNIGQRIDPILMPKTRGLVKSLPGSSTVLVKHTGAKSGAPRTTPLAYFTDSGNVILIASKGGNPKHPAWYHNLKAHPEIELWAGGRGGAYRAREAEGAERERLFDLAIQMYSGYETYQGKTGGRTIPVMVCEPVE